MSEVVKRTGKRFGAFAVIGAVALQAVLFGVIAVPSVSAAPFEYTIQITSSTLVDKTLTIGGPAAGQPYVGQLSAQFVDFDWGDGSPIETVLVQNQPGVVVGPGKNFTLNYSKSHEYAVVGTYEVSVVLYHATRNGNETSDTGVFTIITENTLGLCTDSLDNDNDGMADELDSDCSAFFPANTPPVITFNRSVPVNIAIAGTWQWIRWIGIATDLEDGNITYKMSIFNRLSTGHVGTYLFAYRVTDSGGLMTEENVAVNVTSYLGTDDDSDGVSNTIDNCPFHANPAQVNTDADSFGDVCDFYDMDSPDMDGDGVLNKADICPFYPNPAQTENIFGIDCPRY